MSPPHRVITVWDLPTRLFHWTLALLFVGLVVSGNRGDDALTWHMRMGSAVLALLLFRAAWGLAGSTYARFDSFVLAPRAALAFGRRLLTREPTNPPGHNPLASWNVVLILVALVVQAVSGLFTSDDITTEGPFAALVSEEAIEAWSRVHHRNIIALYALVALHVLAVLFHVLVKRENVLTPMLTGRRKVDEATAAPRVVSGRRAAVLFLSTALIVYAALRLGAPD